MAAPAAAGNCDTPSMSQPAPPAAASQQRWLAVSGVLALVALIALFAFAYWAFTDEASTNNRLEAALAAPDVDVFDVTVTQTYPHDPNAFTEGLAIDGGHLFEGTGLYGQSWLQRNEFTVATGPATDNDAVIRTELPDEFFGEGVTVLGDSVYQLTYKSQQGFVYDRNTLKPTDSFEYAGEGWGLTNNGQELIMSNGSATLRVFDPESFETIREIVVRDATGELTGLNELEYRDGLIYANVFPTSLVAVIEAETGAVTGWFDLGQLEPDALSLDKENVANGIAAIPGSDELLVTGKRWSSMFAIKLTSSLGDASGANPA